MAEKYEILERFRKEMLTCTLCGFCKNVCPVFLDDGWDSSAPRGRTTMAYGLISGELEPDESFLNRIFQCTQCTDCLRRCPSNVKTPEVILAARREMVKRGYANDAQKGMVENIKTSGNIFGDLDVEFPEEEGEMLVFIGCQHLSRPNNTKKTLRLMKKLGLSPRIVQEVCCGFPMEMLGFEEEHERQKERLKEVFPLNGDKVLTFCPSCKVHLDKEYGVNTVHILQEIVDKLDDATIKPVGKTVTYHDPCDLSRGAKITEEPREILRKIGCEIVEMEHTGNTSRCCGGGGGILTWDVEMSNRLSAARIQEAVDTGAEMIVTSCPTCEQTLKNGARLYAEAHGGKPMPVRHIMNLVAKAVK